MASHTDGYLFFLHIVNMFRVTHSTKAKKNICLFTVTSSKKIGQVGRISILFYFFILFHIRKFRIADLSVSRKGTGL